MIVVLELLIAMLIVDHFEMRKSFNKLNNELLTLRAQFDAYIISVVDQTNNTPCANDKEVL